MTQPTILIVEDEPEVLQINVRMMKRRGYCVMAADTAKAAYRCMEKTTPDLLILDIMLPDGSGYEICEKFRLKSDNPVIFLTGKDEVHDKVEGLERGGDYYITKPYSFDELVAAAERLLARHLSAHAQRITRGSLLLDLSQSKAFVGTMDAGLTAKEFAILLLLVKNEDKVISPEKLYEKIWGAPSADDTRTIRFHMGNLKKKIGAQNAEDYDIVSVYGKGYYFTTK